MAARNDRVKKLEAELRDLQQWLKLGLVPKKDIPKHEEEIAALQERIDQEQEKLRCLKESGEAEEFVTPRKGPTRPQYSEGPTLPDLDVGEEPATATESAVEREGDSLFDATLGDEKEEETTVAELEEEEDDPFSDANRWKRGMLHSDEDEW